MFLPIKDCPSGVSCNICPSGHCGNLGLACQRIGSYEECSGRQDCVLVTFHGPWCVFQTVRPGMPLITGRVEGATGAWHNKRLIYISILNLHKILTSY